MMQHLTSNEIYAYWDKIRGAENAPLRSQIEPAAIRNALPDLFMLEAAGEDGPVFRLAGTRICGLFGRELRGRPFHELWAGGRQSNPVDIADGVILHETPALMNVTGFSPDGSAQRFEMILLPIRSSENVCDRLLGALVPAAGQTERLPEAPLACLFMDRSRLLATGDHRGPAAPKRAGEEEDMWGLPVLAKRSTAQNGDDLNWFSPGTGDGDKR